jgi:hypothetical protein
MDGGYPTTEERLSLSEQSFLFVLSHILDHGVECAGSHVCGGQAPCSKTAALAQFARRKFEFEEGLMRSAEYPGLMAHRDDHLRLIRRIENHPDRAECREWAGWIRALAKDWADAHLHNYDKPFGAWICNYPP